MIKVCGAALAHWELLCCLHQVFQSFSSLQHCKQILGKHRLVSGSVR